MALSAEMGLYLDFDVTEDGIPYGCPNLQYFKTENWFTGKGNHVLTWSAEKIPGRPGLFENNYKDFVKAEAGCGFNTWSIGDDTPIYQV